MRGSFFALTSFDSSTTSLAIVIHFADRACSLSWKRCAEHLYEFQFGKRPFDPAGPNIGVADSSAWEMLGPKPTSNRDARTTKLDDLNLEPGRDFGYLFDFSDSWFHRLQTDRIEQAIPTVDYPRIIKRIGKSPPQYDKEEDDDDE